MSAVTPIDLFAEICSYFPHQERICLWLFGLAPEITAKRTYALPITHIPMKWNETKKIEHELEYHRNKSTDLQNELQSTKESYSSTTEKLNVALSEIIELESTITSLRNEIQEHSPSLRAFVCAVARDKQFLFLAYSIFLFSSITCFSSAPQNDAFFFFSPYILVVPVRVCIMLSVSKVTLLTAVSSTTRAAHKLFN